MFWNWIKTLTLQRPASEEYNYSHKNDGNDVIIYKVINCLILSIPITMEADETESSASVNENDEPVSSNEKEPVFSDSQDESLDGAAELPYEASPEYLQRKLYFFLGHLKEFHSKLPETYQVRIPTELLSEMANCLLNDTIFEIVKGLMEIQHVTENHLKNLRDQIATKHEMEIQDWVSKIQDSEELEHILALMKIKHNRELKETDKKLVLHLDQKVKDQQSTLNLAGVPGFYETDNPKEIKIQMFLLDFILRLSRLKFEPGK